VYSLVGFFRFLDWGFGYLGFVDLFFVVTKLGDLVVLGGFLERG